MNWRRILILAPHTDDAELGCGGTIARFIEDEVEVYVATFSTAQESLPPEKQKDTLRQEFLTSMSELNVPINNIQIYNYPVRRFSNHRQEILEDLVRLRKVIQPDAVLLPSSHDNHQDHQVIHCEGMRAFKTISILGYESPWNQTKTSMQAFIELEERHLNVKWKSLLCYQSQIELNRPYFTSELIYGLAKVRGVQCNSSWAESYEVLKVKI